VEFLLISPLVKNIPFLFTISGVFFGTCLNYLNHNFFFEE